MQRGHLGEPGLLALAPTEKGEELLGEQESLLEFHSISLLRLLSVVQEVQLFVFIDDIFHDWACSCHELVEVECLVLLPLLVRWPLALPRIVVSKNIFRGLVKLVLVAEILGLHVPVDVVVAAGDNRGLQGARSQLPEVDILGRLRHKLEHVKELFVPEVHQVAQLLRPDQLLVRRYVVHALPDNQSTVLREAV